MYAIIATGGKQYKVSEGDVIKVEKTGKLTKSSLKLSDYKLNTVFTATGESIKTCSHNL